MQEAEAAGRETEAGDQEASPLNSMAHSSASLTPVSGTVSFSLELVSRQCVTNPTGIVT